ncbi:VOC family protein [Sphingobium sp. CAP-1]|uniref:VOC family protein n=1 Tax=Sphingobium sp. CAP-1 TaxID=2676077 RepID=UPI0012BB2EFC|nr:VOC family protein [Sphingobium sp. CAP-1]QGP80556.1 hypothetical protein GL174_15635 [Sphingobium sp. CAP-1]
MQAFSFTKIQVADIAAAEAFYTTGLGLETVGRVDFGDGARLMHEVIMAVPGARPPAANLILICYPNAPCPAPGEATTGFMVESLDAILEQAVAAGASIDIAPTEIPDHGLRLAYILDPLGHRIELLERLKA